MTFIRSILRTIYQVTHFPSYHHNRHFWPQFKVQREQEAIFTVEYKGSVVAEKLKKTEIEQDSSLVIVATGPSINDIDKSFFSRKDLVFMGVNGATSLQEIAFQYYVIIDYSFIKNRQVLVQQVLHSEKTTLFTNPKCLNTILELWNISEIKCKIKVIETTSGNTISRFMGKKEPIKSIPELFWHNGFGFSSNIEHVVFDYKTVVYSALQIACALGYKSIYIAGLDMTNFSQPRFYENKFDTLQSNLKEHTPIILSAFECASVFCLENNIRVINLSPHSKIDCFKHQKYFDIE